MECQQNIMQMEQTSENDNESDAEQDMLSKLFEFSRQFFRNFKLRFTKTKTLVKKPYNTIFLFFFRKI